MADETTAPEKTNPGPMLPPASVDFNALHDALARGASNDEAIEAAIFPETLALSADEAAARIDESMQTAPALNTLNKDGLKEVAAAEFVTHAHDADGNVIDFADATNSKMIEAILAHRNGAPISPDEPIEPAA